jgi:hypothetical protein
MYFENWFNENGSLHRMLPCFITKLKFLNPASVNGPFFKVFDSMMARQKGLMYSISTEGDYVWSNRYERYNEDLIATNREAE